MPRSAPLPLPASWPWLIATLVGAAVLAWFGTRPPAPRPTGAESAVFSAGRAMADVRAVAREPHPAGTPANARVRAYLVARLVALGFEVHRDVLVLPPGIPRHPADPHPDAALTLVTLVGVRPALAAPGQPTPTPPNVSRRDGSPAGGEQAVALMAHHDSVPGSPGAADDAMGVASILEIARAIPRAAQRRDLVVILTDGEEAGLLGARGFFTPAPGAVVDPLARRIGVVLNLEARGGGGRAQMFETSADNGELMRLYARHVHRPSATSLAASIYRRLPNGTDLTPALAAGVAGLNFSPLGHAELYHSPLATPATIDAGTLQHLGDQALDVARALLAAPRLPGPAPDVVFGDVLGGWTLLYPTWVGWLVLGGAAALVAAAAVAESRGRINATFKGTLRAGGVTLGLGLLAGGLLSAFNLLSLVGGPVNYYDRLAALPRLEVQALLVVLAVLAVATGLKERPAATERWLGPMAASLLLAGVVQAVFPAGAPPFAWPTALAAVALVLASVTRQLADSRRVSLIIAAVAGVFGLAQLATLAHGLLLAIGPKAPGAIAPLLIPALALLALLMPSVPRRQADRVALGLLVAALGVALWVRFDAPAASIPAYVDAK